MFKFRLNELLKEKSKATGEEVTIYQLARDTRMSNTQAYRLKKPMQSLNGRTVQTVANFFGVDPKDTFEFVEVDE